MWAGDQSEDSAVDFLECVHEAAPMMITKVLTDNGSQFTDRFTSKAREPSGRHHFDVRCKALGIEHRLCPPRHPQTNGMVERFNARVGDVIAQTRFKSAAELATTLLAYVRTYNHQIPQRALDHHTPIQALKQWRERAPHLFRKRVHDLPGLESYPQREPARLENGWVNFGWKTRVGSPWNSTHCRTVAADDLTMASHSDQRPLSNRGAFRPDQSAGQLIDTLVAPRLSSMRMSGLGSGSQIGIAARGVSSLMNAAGIALAATCESRYHLCTRLAFSPCAIATCAIDAPRRGTRLKPASLQLGVMASARSGFGVWHGVHLSPWWTRAS
jgi:hypothetical protein